MTKRKALVTLPGFSLGTPANLRLATNINNWQSGGSPVYVSGEPTAQWGFMNSIPTNAGTQANAWTILERAHSIRQNCIITSIKVNVYYLVAPGGATWKFQLYRWNGSAYECIASQDFVPAGSGVVNNIQTFTLNPPIVASEGDIPGLYMPLKNAACAVVDTGRSQPVPVMYGDVLAVGESNAFATSYGVGSAFAAINAYASRPYAIFLGDSIFGGSNGAVANDRWHTDQESVDTYHTPGGSNGDINLSVPYRLSIRMPSNFRYQNFAKGGNTFALTVAANAQMARAVLADPKAVFIHCGVNDVNGGVAWAVISGHLDTIRAAFPAGTLFYLDEVLPWQCDDAKAASTRALNANFATYCTTNGWTLVKCHDEMGQIRVSTGEKDDLIPAYSNGDSVHLSLAGVDKLAEIIRRYVS